MVATKCLIELERTVTNICKKTTMYKDLIKKNEQCTPQHSTVYTELHLDHEKTPVTIAH